MHHLIAAVLASHAGTGKFLGVHHFTADQGGIVLVILILAALGVTVAWVRRG